MAFTSVNKRCKPIRREIELTCRTAKFLKGSHERKVVGICVAGDVCVSGSIDGNGQGFVGVIAAQISRVDQLRAVGADPGDKSIGAIRGAAVVRGTYGWLRLKRTAGRREIRRQ